MYPEQVILYQILLRNVQQRILQTTRLEGKIPRNYFSSQRGMPNRCNVRRVRCNRLEISNQRGVFQIVGNHWLDLPSTITSPDPKSLQLPLKIDTGHLYKSGLSLWNRISMGNIHSHEQSDQWGRHLLRPHCTGFPKNSDLQRNLSCQTQSNLSHQSFFPSLFAWQSLTLTSAFPLRLKPVDNFLRNPMVLVVDIQSGSRNLSLTLSKHDS